MNKLALRLDELKETKDTMEAALETFKQQHDPMWAWLTGLEYVRIVQETGIIMPSEQHSNDESVNQMVRTLPEDMLHKVDEVHTRMCMCIMNSCMHICVYNYVYYEYVVVF